MVSILSRPIGAGATRRTSSKQWTAFSFNPLPPHRGRSYPTTEPAPHSCTLFQSSPAPSGQELRSHPHTHSQTEPCFNPLPPHRGRSYHCPRPAAQANQPPQVSILSRPIGAGATRAQIDGWSGQFHGFNPLPPHRGRSYTLRSRNSPLFLRGFNPLPPHRGRSYFVPPGYRAEFIVSILSRPIGAGATSELANRLSRLASFNPLPPHRGRSYKTSPNGPGSSSPFQSSPAPSGQELPYYREHRFLHPSRFNPLPPHRGRSYLYGVTIYLYFRLVSILSRPIGAGATTGSLCR